MEHSVQWLCLDLQQLRDSGDASLSFINAVNSKNCGLILNPFKMDPYNMIWRTKSVSSDYFFASTIVLIGIENEDKNGWLKCRAYDV